ncbi:MAG: RsmD family RNA methyltransferase [Chitinispirillales bacterium]|jgi:16S rRNA (guanine966-N2)-methyltransferase|nr:RsmD family RNA methyltransferase [Chitinispirillales bacterium]
MKLRIISGELKGRYITIGDAVGYRPTLERIREAVASIVKGKIPGAAVADLCAGSGAFGFEMLSRGARRIDFVDIDKMSAIKIADNAKRLGADGRIRVIRDDVRKFVRDCYRKTTGNEVDRYDIIYYDPPYDNDALHELALDLLPLLKNDGLLIYERRRRKGEKKTNRDNKINMTDVRIFSDTVVEFYTNEDKNANSAIPGDV